ncbi:hypothetical protein R3P38DRAFT_2778530 [Favolaschia claudopus]|uniref:Uncharacterized protein n=1 Tax=Favolaschia claudopus TaxID=2862362 RepID=A0AAW0BHM1_9AGAR
MTLEEEGELGWRGKLSSSDAALALESVKEKSTSSFSTAIRAVTSNAVEIVYEEVRDETTMRARGRPSSRSSRSDAALALETVSNRSELGIQDQRQTGKRDRRRKGNVRLRCPPISTLPPRYPLALADKRFPSFQPQSVLSGIATRSSRIDSLHRRKIPTDRHTARVVSKALKRIRTTKSRL